MVFESLVADLLNRYLGDFVVNLDPKQLNLGIWGGDVKLSNLQLKSSALDDLDLPFKITHGRLNKLVMKIPWSNLYKQPVVVTVSGLYLVAVPKTGLQYNKEKEEKETIEAKQRELRRLEDAKKLHKAAGDAAQQNDSFVEKATTAIIKNLQVEVSDIHIRFEDKFSCPSTPFACGVTLKTMLFVTTNESWDGGMGEVISDASKFVYKLVTLGALSMYWTPSLKTSFNDMNEEELMRAFQENIADKEGIPSLSYILEPIHLASNLRLNPKPELDGSNFQIPKIDLKLYLQSLSLSLSRRQYEGIVLFADALDTITLKSKYRKYMPPEHPIKRGRNAREWWGYCLRCVMEADVKPRLEGWSWSHIKAHREKLRRYRILYTSKLVSPKQTAAAAEELDKLERDLNLFNIVLMRQQAELDAKKLKPAVQEQSGGWFGWMTGRGKQATLAEGDMEKKLAEIMTPEEKSKLYEAIDYKEGGPIAMYPKEFVENRFDFKLKTLAVSAVDDSSKDGKLSILEMALKDVESQIEQRPSAGALKVNAVIKDFNILGADKREKRPELMVPAKTAGLPASSLLEVLFETKPLDNKKEYRLHVAAAPVKATYDAETINGVAKFFKPPESLQLKQLQVAAAAKLHELRESSTAGLRYALEVHKEMEVDIVLNASYFIIPENGVFAESSPKLIVDLGTIKIGNIDEPDRALKRGEENPEKLEASLYDKYAVTLQKLQVIFADKGDDWEAARGAGQTPLHLLQPLTCGLEIHQCILQNDPKRPMLRLIGELPSLAVHITEERILQLCRLGLSIPLPESTPEVATKTSKEVFKKDREHEAMAKARSNNDLKVAQGLFLDDEGTDEGYQDSVVSSDQESAGDGELFFDARDDRSPAKNRRRKVSLSTPRLKTEEANFTSFHMQFSIHEVALSIYRGRSQVPLVKFMLTDMITEVYTRTFDMEVGLAIVDLHVDYTRQSSKETVKMLRRHAGPEDKGVLLRLDYVSAKSNAPDFETTYKKTLQRLKADFLGLDVVLDREGLLEIKQFTADLQEQVSALTPTKTEVKAAVDEPEGPKEAAEEMTLLGQKSSDVIQMDIDAKLHVVTLALQVGRKELAFFAFRDISATVLTDSDKMTVSAQLKRIKIKYPLALGLYPVIVRTLSDEVLSVRYIGYTKPAVKTDINSHDMAVELNLGAVEIIFLNKFVVEILDFFATFQSAQTKLKEVTSTATESAMQSIQSAYADAVRIKMDIRIRAPIIIMPQDSRSNNAILVDLGTLVLQNKFFMTKENAVMDEMKLSFAAVKLSRILFGGDQKIVKEIPLLHQPQAMEIHIVRNLSTLWFTGAPDMSVVGGLDALELRLSKFDYGVLMVVLADNFAEGAPPAPPPRTTMDISPLSTDTSLVPTSSASKLPESPVKQAVATKLTKIRVVFNIGRISAKLYLVDLPDIKQIKELESIEALCGAEVIGMDAHVEMFNDSSMEINATLGNITLDDLRPKSQDSLHRMLERKQRGGQGEADNSKMLKITLRQFPNTDKNIDVVVASIQCNLAMSFYLGLLEFITTTPLDEASNEAAVEVSELGTSVPTQAQRRASSAGLRPPGGVTKRQVSSGNKDVSPMRKPAAQRVRPTGITQINVLVDRPEVILIEDPSLKDSRILVLKTELTFKMTQTPDTTSMDLSCKQLQVFLTTYEKRSELLKLILLPVELGLHGSTPFGGNQKLAVSMGYVNLTISPVAVQTILGVLSRLGQTGTQEVKVQGTDNHSNLWNEKPIEKDSHWFLAENTEDELEQSLELAIENVVEDVFSSGDQLTFNTDSVVVVFETSFGNRTVPMLLVEAKVNCHIEDFSGKMHLTGTMQLEVAYYNDLFDVWEPLLEPVEDIKTYRPWQAMLDVRKNITANENVQALARMAAASELSGRQMVRRRSSGSITTSSSMTSMAEASEALKRTAAMTVSLSSMDSLQLTVSKRTLDVLSKMGESFTAAISSQELMKVTVFSAPYVVLNDTGLDILVTMTGSLRFGDPALKEFLLKDGEKLDLFLVDATQQLTASVLRMQERMNVRPPMIQVKIGQKTADILVSRAETRFYIVENTLDQSKPYRLIAEIQSELGHKQVILRSTVQVENLLPTAMTVSYSQNGATSPLGVVLAGGRFNVPISLVQNYENVSLIYKPLDYEHVSPSEELKLRTVVVLANEAGEQFLTCSALKKSSTESIDNFYFNAFCKLSNVRYSNTHTVTPQSRLYQNLLKPVFSVANLLPVPLFLKVQGALEDGATLAPGGSASICNARTADGQLVFRIDKFGEKDWTGSVTVISLAEEMITLVMSSGTDTINLGLRNVKEQGTTFLTVYAPVWIMNKTGLSLSYKDPIIHHSPDMMTLPILFGGKSVNSKKRVAVQAPHSEWSEKFSLDTVGSSGTLSCNRADGSLAYEFGVSIKPSAAVLTRLVVITPYYLFNNTSSVDLQIREEHPDGTWVTVPKNSMQAFWPQYLSKHVCVKIGGTNDSEATTVFHYGILQTILLRLNNSYGGIYVQTQVTESNVTCSFSLYTPGTASALLINDTERHTIQYRQTVEESDTVLRPQCQQLFTWPHPALERIFLWNIGQEQNKPLDLNRDDAGLCYLADGSPLYWVAFLDGVQRVLLFTDRQLVAQQCSRSLENEISNIEVNVALDGIGLSLVHNTIKREVLYLGIVSPGPIWMGRKVGSGKKLKAMSGTESTALEAAYQKYLILKEGRGGSSKASQSIIITEGEIEITFDASGPALMTRPKPREIQRTYQSGLWCRVRLSDHHRQFHLKLHRIQLDNPILGSRYLVVLYPVPLPSSADYKPFIEVSVVLRSAENSAVQQYKLLTALIQEMEFRLDQAFLNAIIGMFSADVSNGFQERTNMLEKFRNNDLTEISRNLAETVAKGIGEERQAYYERLMLQPIKIHLSFSLSGGPQVEKRSGMAMPAEFITLFIKSIGVTITEANDVVLKLGTFERDYRFISQKQLQGEVQSHYVAQVVKQIYMLVFGLDILGNPFGLVRGIGDGVKDLFYEPYLGAVEGPDEFMAGLGTGVKNFVGGTIGGTMGAVGRVTGTLGRAAAALSFDEEFQARRQAELNRNQDDFAGGMAASGRHLVSGLVEGVTGVVRRPMEGAKEEGVEGFVKGFGKGLVGLVARPVTGVIDFASGSLNTIGRAVRGDTTVKWLRMPRFIPSDGIIRPYNGHQAEGGVIFLNVKEGEFAKTDEYITHLVTARDRRFILMLTHKRVFYLEKGDVIHDWNIGWSCPIDQMPEPPKMDEKGLCVYMNDSEAGKPFGGLFSKSKKSKRVFIEDRDSGVWFCAKIGQLWKVMHDKV